MSNLFQKLNMRAGIEELEEEGLVEPEVTVDEDTQAELEATQADVVLEEEEAGANEDIQAIEETEEAAEELEETVEGMESLMNSSNFNSGAFTYMYNRAVKLAAKAGVSVNVGGTEDFSDAATAKLAAHNGMESFSESLKKFKDMAVEFVKSLFNRMIAFFVGLFDKTKAQDKRIAFLKKRVNGTEGKAKEKVKRGAWAAVLTKKPGDSTLTTTDVISKMVKLSSYQLFNKGTFASITANQSKDSLVGAISSNYKSTFSFLKTGQKMTGTKDSNVGSIMVVGGYNVNVNFSEDNIDSAEKATAALKAIDLKVVKNTTFEKLADGQEMKALENAALSKLLDEATDHVKELQNAKYDDSFSKGNRDKVIGKIGVALKDDDSKDAKEAVEIVKAYLTAGSKFTLNISKFVSKVIDAKISCVAAHYS